MSQDEWRALLAKLARERDDALDGAGAKNGDRVDWLDDTQRSLPVQLPADDDDDDDDPSDLLLDGADFALPPDAIDWLRELAAVEAPEELPDITDYQPPEPGISLSDILRASPEDDALVWLDKLAADIDNAPPATHLDSAVPADYISDFDEDFEDDESLDDESLYSPRGKRRQEQVVAQLGLDERDSADQPRPPGQELMEKNAPVPTATSPVRQSDRLASAFAQPGELDDLEAWYAERLASLAGQQPESAPEPVDEPAPKPETQPAPPSSIKLPPPGLAAAINSARAKVAADALGEALEVYETLLGTPAGLDWVTMDMRALIDEPAHSNDPLLHRVLGDALLRSGQLDEALAAYRQALALL